MSRLAAIAARITLALILAAPATSPLGGQRLGPEMPRPKGIVADTNDAQAYFDFGVSMFERDPRASASAFYWAARINPGMADALYARRAALLMSDQPLRKTFIDGGRHARDSKQLRALDSLYYRALNLNPMLYRRLDRRLLTAHIVQETQRGLRQSGNNDVSPNEINYVVDGWLRDAGPEFRGWIAYGDGNFDRALSYYAQAEKSSKFKAGIRIERGRIFGMKGELDSAITQFQQALTEMRSRDTKDLVFFYDSKALFEHTIGTLLEQKSDLAGAREAYGKALQEDLAYYPAHQRLGLLALGVGDTTTALNELDLAVQIAGDEPFLRYVYGWALASSRKYPDAREQLTKAVALEPYFALPQVTLGQVYERLGDGKNAQAAYTAFLAKASQKDPQRPFATARLKEVSEILSSMPPKQP
jgi:tetratricopeptide (TPR) repeat protein